MQFLVPLSKFPGMDDMKWCMLFSRLIRTWIKFERELLEDDSDTILQFLHRQGYLEGKIDE